METKKEYTAPQLTVVTLKSELGYASSNFGVLEVLNSVLGTLGTGSSSMEGWTLDESNSFNGEGGSPWVWE